METCSTNVIQLAAVDPDPRLRTRLAVQLGDSGPAAAHPSVDALVEQLAPGGPAIVVFGPGMADVAGLAAIEDLTRRRPEVAAILVTSELSTGLLQQALRSGVRDVLGSPTEAHL